MKKYIEPSIEIIVTSQILLSGVSANDEVGDDNEFGNTGNFDENGGLNIDAEDIKGNLWNKD